MSSAVQQRIAVIGAGAAGCFAAANIPFRTGREVVVFEKTGKALQKVKVSGGGRCNVTHACFEVPELVTRYPRGKQLLKKTLYEFGPQQTIDWFAARGVQIKKEEDGRMFPVTDDSQTIIDAVWQEMMRQQVQVRYHKTVQQLQRLETGWRIDFADGSFYEADKVLIATGGFPKKEQYQWITALGHTIEEPVPSLFTFNIPHHPITELMGVAVPQATVKIAGTKLSESGPLLITHWGLSGPSVLRTSAWAARELHERGYEFTALVNWLYDASLDEVRQVMQDLRQHEGGSFIRGKNPFRLPKRLWEYLCVQAGIGEQLRWGDLPAAAQNKLQELIVAHPFVVKGKTTYKEEFVTCGGVKPSETDARTMESKLAPGLYFAGEILNVDGITGGFNFQHAWSSGWIAAQHLQK